MVDPAPLTMLQAAQRVLSQHGSPMKAAEIWADIDTRGLFESGGRTPAATLVTELLRASLGQRVAQARSERYFYKAGEATFGLIEWLSAEDRARLEAVQMRLDTGDIDAAIQPAQSDRSSATPGTGEGQSNEQRPRVWLFAPGQAAHRWDEFRAQSIAAIGWERLGDLTGYPTLEAIVLRLAEERKDGREPRNDALACWEFAHEMKVGDRIFAKRGRTHVVGVGIIGESGLSLRLLAPNVSTRSLQCAG